jgi:hypothetical protein
MPRRAVVMDAPTTVLGIYAGEAGGDDGEAPGHPPILLDLVRSPAPVLDRIAAEALARDPEGTVGLVPVGPDALPPDLASRWGAGRPGEPAVVLRLWRYHRAPPDRGCGLCGVCTLADVGHGMMMCARERWGEGVVPVEYGLGTTPKHWVVPLGHAAPPPHWLYLFGCDRPGEPWYAVRAWRSHLLPESGCGLCPTCRAATTSAGVTSCVVAYRAEGPPSG